MKIENTALYTGSNEYETNFGATLNIWFFKAGIVYLYIIQQKELFRHFFIHWRVASL